MHVFYGVLQPIGIQKSSGNSLPSVHSRIGNRNESKKGIARADLCDLHTWIEDSRRLQSTVRLDAWHIANMLSNKSQTLLSTIGAGIAIQ